VVAIDISKKAIAHEQRLQEQHRLTNLSFALGNLLNVCKLGKQFDYIVCTGVLHHMPDPDAGLRALVSVLKPNSPMFLMVYAYDLRHGVYMMQDICRKMGIQQTPEGVALLKSILSSLPPHHLARAYLARADDLNEAGLVDTFLHPQDRAYTVPQTLAWIRQAGLKFQCWQTPNPYSPDSLPEGPVRDAVKAMPSEEDQWAVVERFYCHSGKQVFYVRKPLDQTAISEPSRNN
jgi:SAM-dependent methyltransferase